MNVRKAHSNSYVCKLARAPRAYLGQHWERVRAAARWNERLSMCWCHLTSAVNVTEPSRLYQCIRSCLACIWFNGECCCCGYVSLLIFRIHVSFLGSCAQLNPSFCCSERNNITRLCVPMPIELESRTVSISQRGHTANPFQTLASHTLTHAYTHASKMKTGKQPDYNSFGERPRWNERKRHGSTFVCPLHCRNNDRLAFVSACTIRFCATMYKQSLLCIGWNCEWTACVRACARTQFSMGSDRSICATFRHCQRAFLWCQYKYHIGLDECTP